MTVVRIGFCKCLNGLIVYLVTRKVFDSGLTGSGFWGSLLGGAISRELRQDG
jgi:hypothetical protein